MLTTPRSFANDFADGSTSLISAVSTAWNMPKPRPAMKVMIIQAVMSGQTHGRTKARPVTTDEAKTNGLRRPTLSESGPETIVAIRMPARLMRPSTGMTDAGLARCRSSR